MLNPNLNLCLIESIKVRIRIKRMKKTKCPPEAHWFLSLGFASLLRLISADQYTVK